LLASGRARKHFPTPSPGRKFSCFNNLIFLNSNFFIENEQKRKSGRGRGRL
jgi:hypothetical protein